MSFIRNCWYVAGWSQKFDGGLQRQFILDEAIVFFRNDAGQVCALADQCPHKRLPLSMGKRIGDTIQCGYHGLTFDCEGKCVRIPGQSNLPSTLRVRRYPVREQHDIVWIWMGDPVLAESVPVFDLPQMRQAGWHCHQGDALNIASNYLNVAENLCDPAHVSFVHPTSLGNQASEDVPIEVHLGPDLITTWRWIRHAPPIGFFAQVGDFSASVDRWHYYDLHLPNIAVIDFGCAESALHLTEAERDRGMRIFALHFLTPRDAHSTVDHWMHVRNFAQDDAILSAQMDELFRGAFAEDQAILEAIQAEEMRAPPMHKPIRLAIDRGANYYRHQIQKRLADERGDQPGKAATGDGA